MWSHFHPWKKVFYCCRVGHICTHILRNHLGTDLSGEPVWVLRLHIMIFGNFKRSAWNCWNVTAKLFITLLQMRLLFFYVSVDIFWSIPQLSYARKSAFVLQSRFVCSFFFLNRNEFCLWGILIINAYASSSMEKSYLHQLLLFKGLILMFCLDCALMLCLKWKSHLSWFLC